MIEESNTNSENHISKNKFVSDTLLVAMLTGVGYMAAFFYQYSYLNYFGIPIFFVDVNLTTILMITAIGLFVILFFGAGLVDLTLYRPRNKFLEIARDCLFAGLTTSVISFLIFMFLYSCIGNKAIILTIFFFVCFFIALLIKIYKKPKKVNNERRKYNFMSKAEELYGLSPVLLGFISVLFMLYSFAIGSFEAKTNTHYLVSNTEPELFLISTYKGGFIGAEYSSSTKTFDHLTLISQDKISSNNIIFTRKKIGPISGPFDLVFNNKR